MLLALYVNFLAHLSVICTTGHNSGCSKFKFLTCVHTCNMHVHVYLLVIALLFAFGRNIYCFHIYVHYFVTLCIRDQMLQLCVYCCRVYVCTTVAVHLNISVQCGKHICSVIYFKYM